MDNKIEFVCGVTPTTDRAEVRAFPHKRVQIRLNQTRNGNERCALVIPSSEDVIRLRDFLTGVIGDRQQPDDAAVERRAKQLWDDDRRSYGVPPGETHMLHVDEWDAWKKRARAELAAEAQPQPDPEAAVLARAKEMAWDGCGQSAYLTFARAELFPKPPAPPATEAEIRARLHHTAGMLPDAAVSEIYSWIKKGDVA